MKLLEEFKTFENVVKKSGNQKVIDGYEGGELSKRLATIRSDAPVSVDEHMTRLPDEHVILDVLKELGYKSLIKRMTGEEIKVDNQGSLFERL